MELLRLLLCFTLITSVWCAGNSSFISERIRYGLQKLFNDQRKTLSLDRDIQELIKNSQSVEGKSDVCLACNEAVGIVISQRRAGANETKLRLFVYNLCLMLTSSNKVSCQGFMNIEFDTLMFMSDNRKDMSSERVCSIYFQTYGCLDPKRKVWDVVIPAKTMNSQQTNISVNEPTQKILHLTDFHYDPLYEPGSNAVCELPLCCQKGSGVPSDPKDAAGFWGDYHVCDVPWHSVLDVLGHIKEQHTNLDHIYYTGDIISHRSWDTSISSNTASIKRIYAQFFETFGKTTIYPILGNHEPHPTNFWSAANSSDPTKFSTQWLFDLVAQEWSRWLPNDSLETVRNGGFYTVLINPKFRIIALNSNVCYIANLWLFYEDKDPHGQLQWLVNTLKGAEEAGESVHILSHVPPGNVECLENWNEVFNKIVNRFSGIIKAQFNGHTHYDEFRVYYDDSKAKVVNVAYNGGSFTPFVGFNPNYRVYDVQQNYEVADYEQWSYNLSEANLSPNKPPRWFKLYSFKQAYNIPSMSLDDLGKLVSKLSTDQELLKKYYRFEVRESEAAYAKGCNETCLNGKLCAIRSVHTADAILCNDI